MIDDSDSSADAADFRQKLDSLEAGWNNVVQSATEQRSVIDGRLALWSDYRLLLDQLRQSLDEVDQSVREHPVTQCDTDYAKQLLDLYQVGGLVRI